MAKQWLKQRILPLIPGMPERIFLLLVIYAWVRLIQYVTGSFAWPMDGDLSFLYYIAWLMNEHDYVPYRDIHETSFFGTFIFYSILTALTGYSTAAFHWVDLFFFSALSWVTFLLLKPYGKLCALLAIALFGEFYYNMGFNVHLQRDFVALLPAAFALLFLRKKNICLWAKAFLAGALFGVASCIKPQFAGGIIVAVGYLTFTEANHSKIKLFFKAATFCAAGFLCVWAAGFAWLIAHNVAHEFLDMAIHYLPAYSSINGRNFARESADAWAGAGRWLWGMVLAWGLPVAISVYGIFVYGEKGDGKQTRYWIIALLLFWLLYLAYVPMAGKYWTYHVLPAYYFVAILLSFIAASTATRQNKYITTIFVSIWLLHYIFVVADENISSRHRQLIESHQQAGETTRALEAFLKNTLKEGDTTQAHVSHTRGPVFPALLVAKALPATPYLENYLLYHDVDSPFVKEARESFLSSLQENPPRYIIYTSTLFGFRGPRTETTFPPFEKWMGEHYTRILASHSEFAPAFDRVEVYEYQQKN
jgi:hypothetical protein